MRISALIDGSGYSEGGKPGCNDYRRHPLQLVRNAQNDIVGLIDSTGKRVVYYKYNSWGKAVNISGTMAATVGQKNPFRYRGYYFDAESGMYYLQSRYYDPEIRRFISADDVGIVLR